MPISSNDVYDQNLGPNGLRFGGKAVWVAVHTNTGYENRVQDNIMKLAESRNMTDKIMEVAIPTKDVIEIKAGGKRVVKTKKLFPGYIYVKMIVDTDTWYLVRNTEGVTGFVGVGVEPTPLLESEIQDLRLERVEIDLDVKVGDMVNIVSGPLEGMSGAIKSIDVEKQTLRVSISMFGRETPTEVEFSQVSKL